MAKNSFEKVIRVYGKEVKFEGGYFVKFSYTKDGKTFYDVKFNRECQHIPTSKGYWLVKLMTADVNIQKVKDHKNDILWIKNTISVERDVEWEKNKEFARQSEVNALLSDTRDDEVKGE